MRSRDGQPSDSASVIAARQLAEEADPARRRADRRRRPLVVPPPVLPPPADPDPEWDPWS